MSEENKTVVCRFLEAYDRLATTNLRKNFS